MEELLLDYCRLLATAKGEDTHAEMEKIRDLTLVNLIGDIRLVIACDSNASNGEKPNDTHKNSYNEMAISALKVPLMEVLATGAVPIVIVNNLCVEMEPSGRQIIEIMKHELEESELWNKIQFTGSTEDNMKTLQSGIGVTVIGLLDKSKSKLRKTEKGDVVICIGIPQSGIEIPYSEKDYSVCKIRTVERLRRLDYVHEILPVGSKGAEYEAWEMAKCVDLSFHVYSNCTLDLQTSAGSSTAVLVSAAYQDADRIIKSVDAPASIIGKID